MSLAMRGNAEHGSSAPKSKRSAAAVQSASLRPFRGGGGGTRIQYGMGGGAGSKPMSFSSTHATPTLRAPQPHPENSVKVCFQCGEPDHFVHFCTKGPQKSWLCCRWWRQWCEWWRRRKRSYNVCTMLKFDGGESVEHGIGEGNNPTLGCEVVAGG